jgi:hypothetical protein
VSNIITISLMLFREIVLVYFNNYTNKNTLREQNAEILIVTAGGTFNWVLNG